MSLGRIAWLTTVGTCLVAAVLLFVSGYQGYGALSLFVGGAAAINVRWARGRAGPDRAPGRQRGSV